MVGIYKITSPSGKVYIGQSINIEQRWKDYIKLKRCKTQPKLYRSFQKYGINKHKFEVIEECSVNHLNKREIYWGIQFNVLEEKGLNLKLGDSNGKCSEETKKKISRANKGKTGKYKRTNKTKYLTGIANSTKIYQFNIEGELIKEWNSITKAEKSFGKGIKDNLSNKTKSSHGFVWSYKPVFKGYNNIHGNNVKVHQKLKNGELIKEWNSITEIKNILGYPTSNISSCCRGKQKTAYGFMWEYKIN